MADERVAIAAVVGAFFVGAIPWGYLVGRLVGGIDVRTVGSGGTGATNVLRALGARASIVVFALDFCKGFLPVFLGRSIAVGAGWIAAMALATVIGHCWSPFIGFRGGKGVATGFGAAVALFPVTLAVVPVMVAVVWISRYVSLGSLTAAGLVSLLAVVFASAGKLNWPWALAIVAMGGVVFARHAGNMRRLMNGTERRLGETVPV